VLPAREALILLTVMNHPWLLASHAEELAELEFRHPDAGLLRRAILDIGAGHDAIEAEALREALLARDFGPILARVAGAITHPGDWAARGGAAAADVSQWWTHVVSLHRKKGALNKDLREAERALGEEMSEENQAKLNDIKAQLATLDGSEAQIEGFGALSGRPVRNL
jgi:DNA primase